MKIIISLCLLLLLSCNSFAEEKSLLSDHGKVSISKVSKEAHYTFKNVIRPWLESNLTNDLIDEYITISRTLSYSELIRQENIAGKNHFLIHYEFGFKLTDKFSNIRIRGMKGQEIVLWIEDNKIIDFEPFDEYTLTAEIIEHEM